MRYVGVDSAYRHTGLVILDQAGRVVFRTHLKNPCAVDHEGWLWWQETAAGLIDPGDVVAIEGLSFGSVSRSHNLAVTFGLWMLRAVTQGRHVFVVPPTRVKRWATGSGIAKKPEMIAWARMYLAVAEYPQAMVPTKVKVSEHEADALVLATLAREAHARLNAPRESPLWDRLPAYRHDILWNGLGTGVLQTPGRSSLKGQYGEETDARRD